MSWNQTCTLFAEAPTAGMLFGAPEGGVRSRNLKGSCTQVLILEVEPFSVRLSPLAKS